VSQRFVRFQGVLKQLVAGQVCLRTCHVARIPPSIIDQLFPVESRSQNLSGKAVSQPPFPIECRFGETQRRGLTFPAESREQRRPSGTWQRSLTQWDKCYPSISALWRRNWQGITPFFQFPPEIRKIVYTTNAIENLNMSLRQDIKTRGAFPSVDAALKVMYLALRTGQKMECRPGMVRSPKPVRNTVGSSLPIVFRITIHQLQPRCLHKDWTLPAICRLTGQRSQLRFRMQSLGIRNKMSFDL
jgi:hypothetical protein